MRYDAVYHYADSDHNNYSKFNPPVIPPAAPLPNETVRVRPCQTKILYLALYPKLLLMMQQFILQQNPKTGTLSKGNNVDKRWAQLSTLVFLSSLK